MKKRPVRVYKNKKGEEFCVGSLVRLGDNAFPIPENLLRVVPMFAGKPTKKAKVVSLGTTKGIVFVSPKLGGYHSWDVEELRKVKYDRT